MLYSICKYSHKDKVASNNFIVSQLQTYKEDFQQERKDRENAHNIKEEEIAKVQVEKEEWIANHHEDLRRIQENYRGQINANAQKVSLQCKYVYVARMSLLVTAIKPHAVLLCLMTHYCE